MQSEAAPKGVRPTGFVRVARAAAAQRGLLSGMRATVAKHSRHSCPNLNPGPNPNPNPNPHPNPNQVAKHSCHSCVYFATFAEMQAHLQAPPRAAAAHTGAAHSAAAHAPGGSGQAGQGRRVGGSLGAGFVAGVAAGTVNNPFDVLKSRQQVALALTVALTLALSLALTLALTVALTVALTRAQLSTCTLPLTRWRRRRACAATPWARRPRRHVPPTTRQGCAAQGCCLSSRPSRGPRAWVRSSAAGGSRWRASAPAAPSYSPRTACSWRSSRGGK